MRTFEPTIVLLGSAPARSMSHALNLAWRSRHGTASARPCAAPKSGQPLPQDAALYLLGLDWRNHVASCPAEMEAASIHGYWRAQLQAGARDYVVLYGQPVQQWQQLAQSLQAQAPDQDWSWLPARAPQAGAAARLRPWGCEQCSDPDCERRLFDALKSAP